MKQNKLRQVNKINKNESYYPQLVLKLLDESITSLKHEYVLDGTKILRETWGENTLVPLYDNEDSVCGIVYNNVPYYFIKNLQGDVIAIANARGEVVARYSYDAWGVCTVVSDTADGIANINPYRYRCYYYDAEIAKYYLQSRYYDPDTGRFINGDVIDSLQELRGVMCDNLYVYCLNAPVDRNDVLGTNSGYINNQNEPMWKNVAVGFWGNVKDNGCGAIAIYNILHYVAGIKIRNATGGCFRFYNDDYYSGKYGTNPISIWKYIDLLKQKGCKILAFWGVAGKLGWW